jgi:peptidoglycan/xylan/chitin deacetylase (PgdA/CDA1 family)
MKEKPLILMYHGVTNNALSVPTGREIGAELYDVSLDKFKAQMSWLKDNHYFANCFGGADGGFKCGKVILTFDDGEMNNFTQALPVLMSFNFKAYFFVIVERIGQPGYMGWAELKKLCNAGMIVGSHGITHRILTQLSENEIKRELAGSLKCLRENLGDDINTLSIPRGFCDDQIIRMAYEVGYRDIFISERPKELKAICWERVAVKAFWDIRRFEKGVNGIKPLNEKVLDQGKQLLKKFLDDKLYDRLRNSLIGGFE